MTDRRLPQRAVADALGPWRLRFRIQSALVWSLWGLVVGLACMAVMLGAARLFPWPSALLWAGGAVTAGLAAGLAYGTVRAPSLPQTARRTDRLLGLADRMATAWELRNADSALALLQRQDALSALRRHQPSKAVSLWPGRRPLASLLGGLALAGLLAGLPNPMDRVIAQRQEIQEQLARAREEVEKTKEELAKEESRLSAQERATLEEALKKLEAALAKADSAPEALAELSKAEEEISRLQESRAGQSRALQRLAQALSAIPSGQALSQALQSGDQAALEQALQALAKELGNMSQEELQELASALQQAANTAATQGQSGLAAELRELAKAAASGDAESAEAALGELGDALAALQQGAASEEAMEHVLGGLRQARNVASGLAMTPPDGTSEGEGGEGAQGSGSGEGSGKGQGEGAREQGSGGGKGNGESGRIGTGEGGQDLGSGGGTGGSGAGDQPGSQLGEGTGRLETGGETVFVPGQGPHVPSEVQTGAGGEGAVPGQLRPYREVIGQYAEQAREHMERSPVPQGYKDLVRRYFAELEE